MTEIARAYVYSGDWVADCPRTGCSNAEHLYGLASPGRVPGPGNPRNVRKPLFRCSNCQQEAQIEWPPQSFMDAVMGILSARPVPGNRNWYPADHAGALSFRIEHGQSLDDLRQENRDHGLPV